MPLALVTKALAALLCIAILLPGCTGMRVIDNQVHTFVPQKIAPGSSYRFERLPSQQAQAPAQDQLEQLTQQALDTVGLHAATPADLTVQVNFEQRQVIDPDALRLGFGWGVGPGGLHGWHHRAIFPGLGASPVYWRQVSLVMRNAQGQVVFESRSTHEGVWNDTDHILTAMLQAALQGFPNPPEGPRSVNIEIPR